MLSSSSDLTAVKSVTRVDYSCHFSFSLSFSLFPSLSSFFPSSPSFFFFFLSVSVSAVDLHPGQVPSHDFFQPVSVCICLRISADQTDKRTYLFMDRQVRTRRVFPEVADDHETHPWTLRPTVDPPGNFSRDFVVISVLMGDLLRLAAPTMTVPGYFLSFGFCVERVLLDVVTIDMFKRVISIALSQRCSIWLGAQHLRLYLQLYGTPPNEGKVHVPFHVTLMEIFQRYYRPRFNMGLRWSALSLGDPTTQHFQADQMFEQNPVYKAFPGVEMLHFTILPIYADEPSDLRRH